MNPEAIKTIRKQLGLSQPQLADVMGIRWATVSEWETGKRKPDSASRRLLIAYIDGYRPADWPKPKSRKETTK